MTTVTHRLRSTLWALATACLVVVVAACARNGFAVTGSTQPGAGPSITSGRASPTASLTTASSPSAGHSSAAQTLGGSRCTSAQLHLRVTPGPNAAGHIGLVLVFTNTSTRTCTMYGYPGVSFVTGHGAQINDPAQRSSAERPSLVTLTPNGEAHASLLLVNVANYAGNPLCQPTQAAGVRVYPPDDTTALSASSLQQICDVKGTGVAQIFPVQTGH